MESFFDYEFKQCICDLVFDSPKPKFGMDLLDVLVSVRSSDQAVNPALLGDSLKLQREVKSHKLTTLDTQVIPEDSKANQRGMSKMSEFGVTAKDAIQVGLGSDQSMKHGSTGQC